ncbi:hypothetical protein LJC02_02940 [Breznakia sp. OttesenSCG-928-G09]|nr:hypothetical protein [Breznakia sp. OttesenSCG-928-G09]
MKREDNLFLERERLLKQGYLKIIDIQKFVPCGYMKAKVIDTEIRTEIEQEEKEVGIFGIPTIRLIKKLHMTEQQVIKYAQAERETKKDA